MCNIVFALESQIALERMEMMTDANYAFEVNNPLSIENVELGLVSFSCILVGSITLPGAQ
jgi:hypothetical protein